jgi:hypothetical protein
MFKFKLEVGGPGTGREITFDFFIGHWQEKPCEVGGLIPPPPPPPISRLGTNKITCLGNVPCQWWKEPDFFIYLMFELWRRLTSNSLRSLSCPQNCNPPASASQGLGVQVYVTTANHEPACKLGLTNTKLG